jgi:hypothetical protein
MAFYYRFEDYICRYARAEDDPARLDVSRTARNLLDLRALLDGETSASFVPPKTSHERLLVAT